MSVDTSHRSATAVARNSSDGHDVVSPVTGDVIERVSLATVDEISAILNRSPRSSEPPSNRDVIGFLLRLKDQLSFHRGLFFERTVLETGFVAKDAAEIVDGAIEFLADFETFVRDKSAPRKIIRHSYSGRCQREMRIMQRPFRCIAAIVPQNASLSLGITIIASALFAGARVILRPSLQCGSTGNLLSRIVRESNPPGSRVEIVNCLASDFLAACNASPNVDLIHYIGSNEYALQVFISAFTAGKTCLLDGQGNGLLYVDETFPLQEAVRIITSGATRFNGETCTSVNGVLIEDVAYDALRHALVEAFRHLTVGPPMEPGVQVGPLFSEKQARDLERTLREVRDGRILCGGQVRGNYFMPAVVEGVRLEDAAVQRGFFGPAIWIQPVRGDHLWEWLRANEFPLSDTVLSTRQNLIQAVARHSRAARICVNGDPSVESMFEPWGGYPPSGVNPVSEWTDKYTQAFQLDDKMKG
jgi:acyl-CoA reductase-like NAD-dependent aldehyde dehydrogenase